MSNLDPDFNRTDNRDPIRDPIRDPMVREGRSRSWALIAGLIGVVLVVALLALGRNGGDQAAAPNMPPSNPTVTTAPNPPATLPPSETTGSAPRSQ